MIARCIIAFIIGFVLMFMLTTARAHNPSRPELDPWYNQLLSGKGLCCSASDGETVADPDWDSKDGHYRVRVDEQWIDVPADAVITEPNRDGRTMVWPTRVDNVISIRCFMPGSMT